MTISCDIIICNNFNGSMTCWRLKLDYLFNTIPNSFTIFNIFKEIITETKKIVLIFFDLCFLRLNKDNSSAVKFKDAISAIWSSIMLFLKRKSQSLYMYVFFSLPSAIQNTGVFWQLVLFQPPRPYSLFLEHGSAAKTLISHPHNSYAGYISRENYLWRRKMSSF